MCDQSPYSIEERLIASVWMHERVLNHQKIPEIRRNFQERFGKSAPTPRVLREWEKKVFELGSVLDASRCGRPATSVEHIAAVEESLLRFPTKSVRKRSAELQIPRSTLRKVIKTELQIPKTPLKQVIKTEFQHETNSTTVHHSLCDQSLEENDVKDIISRLT